MLSSKTLKSKMKSMFGEFTLSYIDQPRENKKIQLENTVHPNNAYQKFGSENSSFTIFPFKVFSLIKSQYCIHDTDSFFKNPHD